MCIVTAETLHLRLFPSLRFNVTIKSSVHMQKSWNRRKWMCATCFSNRIWLTQFLNSSSSGSEEMCRVYWGAWDCGRDLQAVGGHLKHPASQVLLQHVLFIGMLVRHQRPQVIENIRHQELKIFCTVLYVLYVCVCVCTQSLQSLVYISCLEQLQLFSQNVTKYYLKSCQ